MSKSTTSADILLSLTTAPLLLGIIGAKALADLIQQFGQASEEVFRGDRLPVLDLRSEPTTPPNSNDSASL